MKQRYDIWLLLVAFVIHGGALLAGSQNATSGEQIPWQVIANGGRNYGASTNFGLAGTVGQAAIGVGSSANFGLQQGFWTAGMTGPGYVCGDANGDMTPNITDAVYLIQWIFAGGPAPTPMAAGDPNCDGTPNITDAVYLIQWIFAGGPAPCASCP